MQKSAQIISTQLDDFFFTCNLRVLHATNHPDQEMELCQLPTTLARFLSQVSPPTKAGTLLSSIPDRLWNIM